MNLQSSASTFTRFWGRFLFDDFFDAWNSRQILDESQHRRCQRICPEKKSRQILREIKVSRQTLIRAQEATSIWRIYQFGRHDDFAISTKKISRQIPVKPFLDSLFSFWKSFDTFFFADLRGEEKFPSNSGELATIQKILRFDEFLDEKIPWNLDKVGRRKVYPFMESLQFNEFSCPSNFRQIPESSI